MSAMTEPTTFAGRRGRTFGLALRTGLLTLLTLGFYRFWAKTRMRRYYWSSVEPLGVPLEYTGTGVEKLLGFLVAVTFLAFYVGLVNLGLAFISFALFESSLVAYALTFLGIMPFIFAAKYRSRRYILARTRWRGIRFGLEPGAWGYAWRAMLFWGLSIASLGILYPVQIFQLEKYRTNRSFFGSARFHQGGGAGMLYGKAVPAYFGLFFCSGAVGAVSLGADPALLHLLWLGVPVLLLGMIGFHVQAFGKLLDTKTFGGVRLAAAPRTWRVIGIYFGGYLMVGLLVLGVTIVAMYVLSAILGFRSMETFEAFAEGRAPAQTFEAATYVGIATVYFVIFLCWSAAVQAYIVFPRLRHYTLTLSMAQAAALAAIAQRADDRAEEGGGFAEALDVGAAL